MDNLYLGVYRSRTGIFSGVFSGLLKYGGQPGLVLAFMVLLGIFVSLTLPIAIYCILSIALPEEPEAFAGKTIEEINEILN